MEFDLSTVMAFNLKCKHASEKWGMRQKTEIVAELHTKSALEPVIPHWLYPEMKMSEFMVMGT